MKHIGKISGLLGLGALLIAFNLGGAAGCGDDNGSGGGGTETQQEAAAFSAVASLSSFAANSDEETALRLSALAMKAETVDICASGTADISDTAGGATIVFDNCVDDDGNEIDGTITIDSDTDGEEPFISTISFDNVSFHDVDCGDFTISGDSTVSVFLDGTGTIDYSISVDGPDGTFTLDCTLSLDFTCPEFVDECGGFTESEICVGDDFVENISCE
ncbi:MAG TPA: hypothetical protein VFX30_12130 [bacterium]|nr:hypothetical protein [bacterium]